MAHTTPEQDQGILVVEGFEDLKPPKRYNVCILNDNYTHMDFVVKVLQEVFFIPSNEAYALMMQIHRDGKAPCGTYTLDIATTKQEQVHSLAQLEGHPLQCIVEEQT
jgi:ATP-dependent Clp protease adaptor protein ClpS